MIMNDKDQVKIINQRKAKWAILVIDIQNDFCSSEGWYAKKYDLKLIEIAVKKIYELIEKAREKDIAIIYFKQVYNEECVSEVMKAQLNRRGMATLYCQEGTWGAELYKLTPLPSEKIIDKRRFSCFYGTDLDIFLRCKGIDSLIVTGVTTEVCVETTVRDAYMKDYFVYVPKECTASFEESVKDASLNVIDRVFGKVISERETDVLLSHG